MVARRRPGRKSFITMHGHALLKDKNRVRARRLFRGLSSRSPASAAPDSGQAPSPALHLVERKVQLQHIHAGLTENAELTATRITVH
jgi:hypothetical protein